MQVRQLPLRQELGQSRPPCSMDSSSVCSGQASQESPSGWTTAVKKGVEAGGSKEDKI